MSLNEKYIINGSTLSDIGDALRTSGLISPTKEITKLVWYRTNSGSASGNGSSTSTIDQSFFSVGNAVWDGTIAKVKIVITSGNPKINGTQYYNGNTVTVNIPCTISISGSIASPSMTYSYGCKVYPLTSDGQNIDCIQTSSYGGVYSESASVEVPNTIAVEDIATAILASNKQYQIYTADSSVTTGDNIHYQAWSSSGYGGLTMPAGLDYEKMVFCHIHYSTNYDFTYVRDLMPYIANSDKSQIFFPCFYRQLGFPTGSNIIKTRTLRNNKNPYVANSWYGIGYKSSSPQILTAGGVKITAISSNSITLNYQGGLGSTSGTNNSIAIFEK